MGISCEAQPVYSDCLERSAPDELEFNSACQVVSLNNAGQAHTCTPPSDQNDTL